ncbi:DUF2256 domain-containing protein [Ferrovibrio sp.]|uniref:DUF2256 domain-containing protein n=1 Tax=Ferrovibrio sp. TaxID=1917215 RepID=UPI003457AB9C
MQIIASLPWPARQCGLSLRDMHRKPHLPQKICQSCQRPFAWRRKWARHWDEVLYCSDACRRRKNWKEKSA